MLVPLIFIWAESMALSVEAELKLCLENAFRGWWGWGWGCVLPWGDLGQARATGPRSFEKGRHKHNLEVTEEFVGGI